MLDIGYSLSRRFPDPPQTDYRRADVQALRHDLFCGDVYLADTKEDRELSTAWGWVPGTRLRLGAVRHRRAARPDPRGSRAAARSTPSWTSPSRRPDALRAALRLGGREADWMPRDEPPLTFSHSELRREARDFLHDLIADLTDMHEGLADNPAICGPPGPLPPPVTQWLPPCAEPPSATVRVSPPPVPRSRAANAGARSISWAGLITAPASRPTPRGDVQLGGLAQIHVRQRRRVKSAPRSTHPGNATRSRWPPEIRLRQHAVPRRRRPSASAWRRFRKSIFPPRTSTRSSRAPCSCTPPSRASSSSTSRSAAPARSVPTPETPSSTLSSSRTRSQAASSSEQR